MEILDNLKIYFYSNSYTGDWGEGDACISQSPTVRVPSLGARREASPLGHSLAETLRAGMGGITFNLGS